MNDTYCKYFWSHVALFNGTNPTPCCRYDHSNKTGGSTINRQKKFTTFTETIHSPEWEELRRKAIEGEKEPGCWKCYEEEERGSRSLRNIANDMDFNDDNELKLTYLEINLGNYCNLACNICCSDNSNLWYEDDKDLIQVPSYKRGNYRPDSLDGFTLDINDYKSVRLIKFVGGEPMIHPKFITLLDFLIENNLHRQIQIQVFTNASWTPKQKIKDRLKQFDSVTISLSVDGIGQVNDYSRWPSKWSIVNKSCEMWLQMSKEHSNINVRWEPTLSIYNANHIPEMLNWWFTLCMNVLEVPLHDAIYNKEIDDCNIIFNNVMWPLYMRASLLVTKDIEFKKLDRFMEKTYRLHFDNNSSRSKHMFERMERGLKHVKSCIAEPTDYENLKIFGHFSYDLDNRRKNNITTQLPKLWSSICDYTEYSTGKT